MAWVDLTVQEWKDEIDEGLEYRRRYGLENHWAELEELFYHVHKSNLVHGPNLISSNGDILLSTLGVPYPYIGCRPRKSIYVDIARIVESVDNMLICDMQMPDAVDVAMLAAYITGVGFLKIGYDSEWGWDPRFDIGVARDGNPMGVSLSQFDSKGWKNEFGLVKPGMPWIAPVMAQDIVFPWGTRSIETAPYFVHRVCRHIDDVLSDPKYSNKKDLRPVMSQEDMMRSYTSQVKPYRMGDQEKHFATYNNDVDYCELWEIHDRRTGQVIVVATGHPKFLRKEKDLLQMEGLPLVDIAFTPRLRSVWTTPDAYYLKAIQAELTDITIQSAKTRRLSVLKWLVKEGEIANDELKKMTSSDVGAIAKVKARLGPLSDIVMAVQSPGNNLLYQEAEMTRRNGREIIGAGRNQLGEYEQVGRRTASEVNAVSEGSGLRMGRRQNQVRKVYVRSFEKINAMITEFWKTPRIAEIVDEGGASQWKSFVGEDLRGEFAFNLTFSSAPDESMMARRQNALMMLQMFAQDPTVDQIALRRWVISELNSPGFTSIFSKGMLSGQASMGQGQGQAGLPQGQNQGGAGGGGPQPIQPRLAG